MKTILLLILGLTTLIFSGCASSINVDDGVIRSELGESVVNPDTNAVQTEDILLRIATGDVEGFDVVHKFGTGVLTNTMEPITQSGFYRVPSTITSLEFVSDDADDTYLGTGARQITLTCVNSTWQEEILVINTSGTTPVQLPQSCYRVNRWKVSSSGSYANQNVGSHEGELTIRESGAGQIWSIIPNSPFPVGQSEIGIYTIPKGKTGFLLSKNMFADTTKTADLFFYARCNTDDTTSPYTGTMNLVEREIGLTGGHNIEYQIPKGPFVGPCDIGFMGMVSVGTADASVEFELVLVDTP